MVVHGREEASMVYAEPVSSGSILKDCTGSLVVQIFDDTRESGWG